MKSSFKLEAKTNSLKVKDIRVNVHSNFNSEKRIDDILYSIANVKLKEKSA